MFVLRGAFSPQYQGRGVTGCDKKASAAWRAIERPGKRTSICIVYVTLLRILLRSETPQLDSK